MKPPRPAASQAPARLAGLLLAGLLASSTWAATGTWTSGGSGNWSDTSRWSGGTVANGAGFTANFGTASNPTSDVVVTLDTARVIGSLAFGDSDTGSAAGWKIAGGNTLTLSATTSAITVNALGTGKLAEISAPLAGSGGFTKQGGGTLLLSGNNSSLSGTISIKADGGKVAINSAAALGSAGVNMPDTVSVASGFELIGGITLNNSVRIAGGGPSSGGALQSTSGDNVLTNFGFSHSSAGGRIHVEGGSSLRIQNSFVGEPGNFGIRFIGTGTLILDADNSAGLPNRNVRFGSGAAAGPVIQVGHDKALGTGMIYFEANSNSTLQSKNASARSLPNSITFTSSSATLGAAATGDLGVAGAVTLGAAEVRLTVHNTVTFSGAVGDSGAGRALTKAGPGTLVLEAANTYTGATKVDSGTLVIDGHQTAATGTVTVNSGGTLGGSGTLGGDLLVKSGGTHAPGNSSGLQTIKGDATYATGSLFAWDLAANKDTATGGLRGSDYDAVTIDKKLTVEADVTFRVIQNTGVAFSDPFWKVSRAWTDIFQVTGSFTGWAVNSPVAVFDTFGNPLSVSSFGNFTVSGKTLQWTAVPEPTGALAGLLLGTALFRRRRAGGNRRA